jgi:hypothetical protein
VVRLVEQHDEVWVVECDNCCAVGPCEDTAEKAKEAWAIRPFDTTGKTA